MLGENGLTFLFLVTSLALFVILGLRFWRLGDKGYLQTCVLGRAFAEALLRIFLAPCSSLTPAMFGREMRLCFGVLAGGVWNGFLLGKVKGQHVPCRFCSGADGDGHLFWDCTFPPLVEIREHPEFYGLSEMDTWPRCLLWHGWLPLLSGVNGGSPWADDPAEGAGNLLECALGSETSGFLEDGQLLVGFDAGGAAERVAAEPDVWIDGSLVEDQVSGASSSGSGTERTIW